MSDDIRTMPFIKAISVDEVKPGHSKVVSVNGKELAIFNIHGKFFAADNACPHEGGPLGEGDIEENIVVCPWHGWRFNIEDGKSLTVPGKAAKTYKVKVKGNDIFVDV